MIRRLYVDNFRSLVDFTWEPGEETLVLGYNGSGKTSAVEAIKLVRDWASGQSSIGGSLSRSDWTKWEHGGPIRIDIDLASEGKLYRYVVHFSLDARETGVAVRGEQLHVDESLIFIRNDRFVSFHPQVGSSPSDFPLAPGLSVLSVVGDVSQGTEAVAFRNALSTIVCVKPEPPAMESIATTPSKSPLSSLENLPDWLLFLFATEGFQDTLTEFLQNVWPELLAIDPLLVAPSVYRLNFLFDATASVVFPVTLGFNELSDGERMLVGLYSIAAYQSTHSPTTIIIDEPDNYVSLLEIQPWLLKMLDTCPAEGQLILVSHNEEMIRTMGREKVAYFSRKDNLSPTEVRAIRREETDVAPLRDLLRLGRLDERGRLNE